MDSYCYFAHVDLKKRMLVYLHIGPLSSFKLDRGNPCSSSGALESLGIGC